MATVNARCTCLPLSNEFVTCASIFCRKNLPSMPPPTATTTARAGTSGSANTTRNTGSTILQVRSSVSQKGKGNDPYVTHARSGSRKFVGGAEMARRNATLTSTKRKRGGTRIILPGEKEHSKKTLPSNLPPHERFFAALLRSKPAEFVVAERTTKASSLSVSVSSSSSSSQSQDALAEICQRVRLPIPLQPVPASYSYCNYNQHFAVRAALVLEEARHAIAEGLATLAREQQQQQQSKKSSHSSKQRSNRKNNNANNNNLDRLCVTLKSIELREKTNHSVLNFLKINPDRPFLPQELACLRPGTVLACRPTHQAFSMTTIRLVSVIPANREEIMTTRSFPLLCFDKVASQLDSTWEIIPITSLLSELRKFEACTNSATMAVPFLPELLGGYVKNATHTRFSQDSETEEEVEKEKTKETKTKEKVVVMVKREDRSSGTVKDDDPPASSDSSDGDDDLDDSSDSESSSSSDSSGSSSSSDEDVVVVVPPHVQKTFELPPLNLMQEKAASIFLKSSPNTITLVQGPPGTGKTTLLVSVICRYLMESSLSTTTRCLLVCAPTNKAVAVLCTRFLESIKNDEKFPVNAVLVGDDDKMFDDLVSPPGAGSEFSTLRPIFLYTWIRTVLEDYARIRRFLAGRQGGNWHAMIDLARNAEKRLQNQLTGLPNEVREAAKLVSTHLRKTLDGSTKKESPAEAINAIDRLLQNVQKWKNESIWTEILSTAHVVFCTLASAGASVLKRSSILVEDLIVDEAAAATEPELYIPFQYCPNRLLAVGDPKQLPATVTSQRAVQLGLSKSLHERLMYDCKKAFTMLNVQYRMKPEISEFPSDQFYGGKIINSVTVANSRYTAPILLLQGQSYSFLQVNGRERQSRSGSFENEAEAKAVVALIEQLQSASHRAPGHWRSVDRIRIITFYQAQVHLIKQLLRSRRLGDIVVATVDSSQGSEADIVIVSFVRSNTGRPEKSSVGFLSDDRRLNVALTRAKYQLISVGNAQFLTTLEDTTSISQVACNAMKRECVRTWPPPFDRNEPSKRSKESRQQHNSKRPRIDTGNNNKCNRNQPIPSSSSSRHTEGVDNRRISPTVEANNKKGNSASASRNHASVKEEGANVNSNQAIANSSSNDHPLAKDKIKHRVSPTPEANAGLIPQVPRSTSTERGLQKEAEEKHTTSPLASKSRQALVKLESNRRQPPTSTAGDSLSSKLRDSAPVHEEERTSPSNSLTNKSRQAPVKVENNSRLSHISTPGDSLAATAAAAAAPSDTTPSPSVSELSLPSNDETSTRVAQVTSISSGTSDTGETPWDPTERTYYIEEI